MNKLNYIPDIANIKKVIINRKQKIIEDQKINEDEDELTKYQSNIINKHEFDKLKSCKKLILNGETKKAQNSSLHLVSQSFF